LILAFLKKSQKLFSLLPFDVCTCIGPIIHDALRSYKTEVREGTFPGTQFAPYKMVNKDSELFAEALAKRRSQASSKASSTEGAQAAASRASSVNTKSEKLY